MFFARPAKLSITDYGPDGKPAGEVRAVQARSRLESNYRFQSLIVKNDNSAFNLNPVFLSSHSCRKPHTRRGDPRWCLSHLPRRRTPGEERRRL